MSHRTAAALLAAVALLGAPAAAFAQDEAPGPEAEVTVVEAVEEGGEAAETVVEDVPVDEEENDEDVCAASVGEDEEEEVDLCEDEESDGDDDFEVGDSKAASVKTALKRGWVDGGTVKLSRGGRVTQKLRYRGKVVGTATKTLKKGGKVRLRIELTKAGRKALRSADGRATLALKTTRTLRGAKTATSTEKIVLK